MKKYMLFGFDDYYPCGGMSDFKCTFDTYEEFEEQFDDTILSDDRLDNQNYQLLHVSKLTVSHLEDIHSEDIKGLKEFVRNKIVWG